MFIYRQIRCIALRVMQASKGFWVYLLRQSFELGARSMQITMFERTCPAWSTKTKLRINGEGNRDGEWNFCRGKEADIIALFLQVTRIRQLRKISQANEPL